MKTIKQYLEDLHEPERTEALTSLFDWSDAEIIEAEHHAEALYKAFVWADTMEGRRYWERIYDELRSNTYFEAPQLTPEKCEAKAKGVLYTAPPTEPHFGTELAAAALPTDAAERKQYPIYSGFMCYFPHAIAAVANLSYKGNLQHHPDKPLHWDMDKSQDELDALMRHMVDGDWEQVAWRAMANLERKLTGKCQYTNK